MTSDAEFLCDRLFEKHECMLEESATRREIVVDDAQVTLLLPRYLPEFDIVTEWFGALNEVGELTLCLTDGRDLLVHADRRGAPLHLGALAPPYERIAFGDADLDVDLTRRGAKSRKGVIVCSEPLSAREGDADRAVAWRQLEPGALLVIREGAVVNERSTGGSLETPRELRRPTQRRSAR